MTWCHDSNVRPALVLVVDDHPGFRRLARRMLERAGFTVAEAESGADAVAAAAELQPDVVLLDIQLPDVDGFAVARSLAVSEHPSPVVLTSTREASDYGERISASSAIAFLPKTDFSGAALRKILAGA
jgi:CheY-like chemotaxis protein